MPEHDDLTRLLESFGTGGVHTTPVPPAQVRRLGDRRRRRHQAALAAAAAVAVAVAIVPVALLAGGDSDSTPPITHTPSPTPTVTTYPGVGIEVKAAADTSKLTGTSDDFKTFIAGAWQHDAAGCPTPEITVKKYSSAGYALGGVGGCGPYAALWVAQDGHWKEALATQDEWLCGDLARFDIPTSFAGECYGPAEVLGPVDDYGLRLGMSMDEVRAAGGWVSPKADGPGDYCRTVNPKGVAQPTNPNGTISVLGYLSLDPNRGVVALFAQKDQVTSRGIRIGSTVEELKAAYPEATRSGFGSYYVTIDETSKYRFDIEQDDTVSVISLVLDGPQGCYE